MTEQETAGPETEDDWLDVALVLGDVACEVTSGRVESYDDREVTIRLTEDGLEEFVRELRLQDYSDDAEAWLDGETVGDEKVQSKLIEGHAPSDVETGEKILESPLTGNTYRVTKWVDQGDGKFVAIEKELVEDDDDLVTDGGTEEESAGDNHESPIIGYVVDEDPQITACVGCVFGENLGPRIGEIRDGGVYGDEVPYPECGNCGEVIRPQETSTLYECSVCGDRFETINQVESHSTQQHNEVHLDLFDVVERDNLVTDGGEEVGRGDGDDQSEVPSLAEAYPDDFVHCKPLPPEHELDDAECHNCGEPWNGGEDWDERHLHGGPSLGEDWKYECPGCGHETFEVGI